MMTAGVIRLMPDTAPIELEYEKAPPLRRRWFRRIVLGLGLLLVVAACVKWRRDIAGYVAFRIVQDKCRGYTAPADQVVYEQDDQEAAKLLAGSAQYADIYSGSNQYVQRIAGHTPQCLTALTPLSVAPPAKAVLFLHQRRSPSGERAIVAVRFQRHFAFDWRAGRHFEFEAIVIPASFGWPPPAARVTRFGLADFPSPVDPADDKLKIFAGQPDPKHEVHFTIPYKTRNKDGYLEGWLDDGYDVRLYNRNAPAGSAVP
jgi:hypothetical protein